jgi:hypothetical protein
MYWDELEIHAEDGNLLEICKTGEMVKNTLQKIKDLEYSADITPETFY